MNRINPTSGQAPESDHRGKIRGHSKEPEYVTYAEAILGKRGLGRAWKAIQEAHPSAPSSLEDELRDKILEAMEEVIMLNWDNISPEWHAKAVADVVSKSLRVTVTPRMVTKCVENYNKKANNRIGFGTNCNSPGPSSFNTRYGNPRQSSFATGYGNPGQSSFDTSYGNPGQSSFDTSYVNPRQSSFETSYGNPRQSSFDTSYVNPGQSSFDTNFGNPGQSPFDTSYGNPTQSFFNTSYSSPNPSSFSTTYDIS